MKIRFGANDTIDTKNAGSAPENYEEVENAAFDTYDSLDDGSTSMEDQTQLSILKRFVKGFLAGIADGCGRAEIQSKIGYTLDRIYEEFDDIVASKSSDEGWAGVADAIQYDDVEPEGEGEGE